MGVQGLASILEAGSCPRVEALGDGDAAQRRDNLLLVDAPSVLEWLSSKLEVDWQSPDYHAHLYRAICRFYGGLQRTGLRLVLLTDSAPAPGSEAAHAARCASSLASAHFAPPTSEPVALQAYADLGLQAVRSAHSAGRLLTAWAQRNADSLFAALTTHSDVYVHAVAAVAKPWDVVVDPHGVTFHLWEPAELWRTWHASTVGSPTLPPLYVRAQVAAVLAAPAVAAAAAPLMPPSSVARSLAQHQHSSSSREPEVLPLEFFRSPPLSLRTFDDQDLAALNATVRGHLDAYGAARNGAALRNLTLTPEALPWLHPTGDAAPGASYEFDPNGKLLYGLTAAPAAPAAVAGPAAAQWFAPGKDLPSVDLAGDAAEVAAAVPERQATLAETAAAVAAALPGLPPTLVTYGALLLHAVDPDEAAWDPPAVRALLLPGVPPAAGAAVAAPPSAEEEAAAAAAAAIIDVGSALNAEDWADIDAKEVVAKTRAGPGYALLKRIRPWAPPSGPRSVGGAGGDAPPSSGVAGLVTAARAALAAGPNAPEWAAAERAWRSARPAVRQQALTDMWGCANRWLSSAAGGGGPARHLHQQEILDLVDEHLKRPAAQRARRPLHVILSTPTGSGKTFTAVMMQLHVLKGRRPAAGGGSGPDGQSALAVEQRPGHPDAILVYSVPTKQASSGRGGSG
ncbi:hypothetical protein GPECTOR_5g23 [Gonium pectorale]|uniref:Uncharacterized protein n=1 Tax=Gonium pectorale TaxID=33097 RepID=A0A150GWF1_GONPE|nr:hypothetical protein GPECTOR_5g23 [Gonium pectorale]|eukprot:KXZ54129.1 hypothetical protein GPECTOR_5g23 [Gonium pectorale]